MERFADNQANRFFRLCRATPKKIRTSYKYTAQPAPKWTMEQILPFRSLAWSSDVEPRNHRCSVRSAHIRCFNASGIANPQSFPCLSLGTGILSREEANIKQRSPMNFHTLGRTPHSTVHGISFQKSMRCRIDFKLRELGYFLPSAAREKVRGQRNCVDW